jgi:hypothetical protein
VPVPVAGWKVPDARDSVNNNGDAAQNAAVLIISLLFIVFSGDLNPAI